MKNQDETPVNFILYLQSLKIFGILFSFIILLTLSWIGQEGETNHMPVACFTVSSFLLLIAYSYCLINSFKKESKLEYLYYEFTTHFFILPIFWLSFLIYTITEEQNPLPLDTLTLLGVFSLALLATWVCVTLIIQGSEKIINFTDEEKIKTRVRCRTDIRNFLYKHNVQVRLFLLILMVGICMNKLEIFPNDIRIGSYIFGTIGLSFLITLVQKFW